MNPTLISFNGFLSSHSILQSQEFVFFYFRISGEKQIITDYNAENASMKVIAMALKPNYILFEFKYSSLAHLTCVNTNYVHFKHDLNYFETTPRMS